MPSVSYVVTVYNKAPYLSHLVDGLASQQGGFTREFIFVDDGSTDDSLAVLRKLTEGWRDVRIIAQANAGPALALNAGLAAAGGDFIKPVDGDDMLTPQATQALLDAIAASGCGLAFGPGGHYRLEEGLAAARQAARASTSGAPAVVVSDTLLRSLRRAQTTPSAWLAKAELVRRCGGCDPGVFIQDYSIELRLACLTQFARIATRVYRAPVAAPGRMSLAEAQTLHDINLALAHLVAQHGELPRAARRFALRRAAGRAWAYARRHGGRGYLSPEFRLYLRARLGLAEGSAAEILACCAIFRALVPIRLNPSPLAAKEARA